MTPSRARADISDQRERKLSPDPIDAAEPIESTDRIEPAEPMERIEPAEPIERIDPLDAIDRIEPSDQSDQRDGMRSGVEPVTVSRR